MQNAQLYDGTSQPPTLQLKELSPESAPGQQTDAC